MTDQLQPLSGEFLLYETENGRARVECRFVQDSLWLTQALMPSYSKSRCRPSTST